MIGLLACRLCERVLDVIVRRGQRLPLVKGLSTHFPAMVHAHQGPSIAAYFVAKIFLGDCISRLGRRATARRQYAQGLSNSRRQRSRSSAWRADPVRLMQSPRKIFATKYAAC